jgi:hypothetical protein
MHVCIGTHQRLTATTKLVLRLINYVRMMNTVVTSQAVSRFAVQARQMLDQQARGGARNQNRPRVHIYKNVRTWLRGTWTERPDVARRTWTEIKGGFSERAHSERDSKNILPPSSKYTFFILKCLPHLTFYVNFDHLFY